MVAMNDFDTFNGFLRRAVARKGIYPSERMGQAYFNCLAEMRPDIAEKVRGQMTDPFFVNERIPAFLTFVCENW